MLETESDPYSAFVYGMRSPKTREKCIGRLRAFFDFIRVPEYRCKAFCERVRQEGANWLVIGEFIEISSILEKNLKGRK